MRVFEALMIALNFGVLIVAMLSFDQKNKPPIELTAPVGAYFEPIQPIPLAGNHLIASDRQR